MSVQPLPLDEIPALTAQVRRFLGVEEVTLFRVSSGTILAFEGAMDAERAMRTPPDVLIRAKDGGGFELTRAR